MNNTQTILTTRIQELQQRTQDLIEEYKAVLNSNLTQQILIPLTQLPLWSKTKIKEENIIYTLMFCYICPHTLTDCFVDEKILHIFLNLGGYKYDWRDSVIHTLYHYLFEIKEKEKNAQYNNNFVHYIKMIDKTISQRNNCKSFRSMLNRTTLPTIVTALDYIEQTYECNEDEIQDLLLHLFADNELQATLQEESFIAQNVLLKYSAVEAFVEDYLND